MKLYGLLAVILSTLLLQGCIGAAVIGTAAVATKATTDPRSTGTQVDDTTIEVRVNAALTKDKAFAEQGRIVATAYQGSVLLTGQVPTQSLANQAQDVALNIEGVKDVYNELRIGPTVSIATASTDAWITTKIRSKLLTSNAVKSAKVKVITENGEVFLLGYLTQQEGRAAAKIASNTQGVKKVTTVFSYLQ